MRLPLAARAAAIERQGEGSAYAEDRFVEISDLAVARYLKDDPAYS